MLDTEEIIGSDTVLPSKTSQYLKTAHKNCGGFKSLIHSPHGCGLSYPLKIAQHQFFYLCHGIIARQISLLKPLLICLRTLALRNTSQPQIWSHTALPLHSYVTWRWSFNLPKLLSLHLSNIVNNRTTYLIGLWRNKRALSEKQWTQSRK